MTHRTLVPLIATLAISLSPALRAAPGAPTLRWVTTGPNTAELRADGLTDGGSAGNGAISWDLYFRFPDSVGSPYPVASVTPGPAWTAMSPCTFATNVSMNLPSAPGATGNRGVLINGFCTTGVPATPVTGSDVLVATVTLASCPAGSAGFVIDLDSGDDVFGASVAQFVDKTNDAYARSDAGMTDGTPLCASEGPVVRDQSDVALDNNFQISSGVTANDFTTAGTRLTSAVAWLADNTVNDNGVLDSFSGELSWAVYSNASSAPDTLLQSGRALGIVQSDTGLQDVFGDDIVAVRFDLDPPFSLLAGTYWLALHEGSWESASDPDEVWWQLASTVIGSPARFSDSETSPGSWAPQIRDNAFVLFGTRPGWDQFDAGVLTNNNLALSSAALANDFVLGTATRLGAAEIWVADNTANDNGLLDSFAGTLGWAVYSNSGGAPGSLLASGQDTAPTLVDTGAQDPFGGDVVRLRFRFGNLPELPAGTYWLAIHEGNWGSADDGSEIWWQLSSAITGSPVHSASPSPGIWSPTGYDTAFVLFDEVVFASGFRAGGTCSWSSAAGGDCP